MKRPLSLLLTLSLLSAMALTGCGGDKKPATSASNTVQSTESETSAPTQAATEARTLDPNYETLAVDPDTPIIAMDNNLSLKGIDMKAPLSTLVARFGSDYKYNSGSNTYQWTFDNGTRILATCDAGNAKLINSIDYAPANYDNWRDPNNDFSQVDANKTYTYAELYSIVRSPGTVFKLSADEYNHSYYYVCWYDDKGNILYVQFNSQTNESVHITIL